MIVRRNRRYLGIEVQTKVLHQIRHIETESDRDPAHNCAGRKKEKCAKKKLFVIDETKRISFPPFKRNVF